MARLEVIIKGEPQDHVVRSGSLSDDEAAEHLISVGRLIGRPEHITLPWLVTAGPSVRFARIISDEPTPASSAGGSITGDLREKRW